MLPKRQTHRPSKYFIFKFEDENLPKIQLTQPTINNELSNSFIEYTRKQSRTQKVIDSYGLLTVSQSPCLNSSSVSIRKIGSKICIADFLGEKNSKQLISAKKLLPLKQKLNRKIYLKEVKEKSCLNRPTTPNIMDQNTKLRLFLEKSRRGDNIKVKKRRGSKSLNSFSSVNSLNYYDIV